MEIIPGIHLIKGSIANCYVIGEEELGLVDTGMPHNAKRIIAYLTQVMHRSAADVKWIALTHCDVDHAGSVVELRQMSGAQVVAHPADAEIMAGRQARPQHPVTWGARLLSALTNTFIPLFGRLHTFEVDRRLNEGDRLGPLTVYHVPGHSPGSIALLDSKRSVLFTGDALMYERGKFVPSPPAFTADSGAARESLRKIASLEFDIMLGGHGNPLIGGASGVLRKWLDY